MFRENKSPVLTGRGKEQLEYWQLSFHVLAPANICACSNKSDLPIARRFKVTCIDQSSFKFCPIKL